MDMNKAVTNSSTLRQWAVGSTLLVWAGFMTFLVSCLMVGHWISLPHPKADNAEWAGKLTGAAYDDSTPQWLALHVLYADCPCSIRILKQVVQREAYPGIRERIVLIGENPELAQAAQTQGYEVECVTPEQLWEQYGLESAPMLVVLDPDRSPRYSGGYTSRKQGPDIQDTAIIEKLLAGQNVESLPVYGCAVSNNLQSIVDPLGIKYSND